MASINLRFQLRFYDFAKSFILLLFLTVFKSPHRRRKDWPENCWKVIFRTDRTKPISATKNTFQAPKL